jgi:RNA polymerase sigma-54 factor
MARQRIGLNQNQRMQLNLSLQESLRILRMDAGGLTRYLQEHAARNPFVLLEEAPALPAAWLPRWSAALAEARGAAPAPEMASPAPSLMAHVLAQIEAIFPLAEDRKIALVLAEALEPSGWLGRPVDDLARQAGCAPERAEAVLHRLQQMEPSGLFARSLAECLRMQARDAERLDSVMEMALAHLDLVATGDTLRLAALCDVPESRVLACLRVIRSFDPKPGTQFDPGACEAREPDLVAVKGTEGWDIELNRSALPALSVRRPAARPAAPADRAALAEALGLCRVVERRNLTLLRVAREVMRHQVATLDHGLAAARPLTLAEVADLLDLHESTVSRVVAGVSIATPRGTWRLRAMFGAPVGDSSAAAIRARIGQLVASENPKAPLTDQDLTEALAACGCTVARRTVAKYRTQLRIPPAGSRRRRARSRRPGKAQAAQA